MEGRKEMQSEVISISPQWRHCSPQEEEEADPEAGPDRGRAAQAGHKDVRLFGRLIYIDSVPCWGWKSRAVFDSRQES